MAALSDVSRSRIKTELLPSAPLPVAVELLIDSDTSRPPSETVLSSSGLLMEPSFIFAKSVLLMPLTLGIMAALASCSSRLKADLALTSYLQSQLAKVHRSAKVCFILHTIHMSGHVLVIRESTIVLI